jgi:hypothetical protein
MAASLSHQTMVPQKASRPRTGLLAAAALHLDEPFRDPGNDRPGVSRDGKS